MRVAKGILVVAALVGVLLVPAGAEAATVSCVDNYLLCVNDASQESGAFWRTLKETECGVDYYGCIRSKVMGS